MAEQAPGGHDPDPTAQEGDRHEFPGTSHGEFTIHIDKSTFRVASTTLTGAQLRQLPTPSIGPDFDLWEDVPGGNDKLIRDGDVVQMRNGMHFFTAPSHINPGGV